MIQRIQTVYLFLAGVAALLMYFSPLASFKTSELVYHLNTCHFTHPETGNQVMSVIAMAVLPVLSTFLSFFTIFLYKNRRFQMNLCKINLLILVALMAVEVIYYFRIGEILDTQGKPMFMAVMPLLSFIFVVLANRSIKKDDNLIKSADRIR